MEFWGGEVSLFFSLTHSQECVTFFVEIIFFRLHDFCCGEGV